MSTFFLSMLTIAIDRIPPERLPSATGISNFARIVAGSFAAASVFSPMAAPPVMPTGTEYPLGVFRGSRRENVLRAPDAAPQSRILSTPRGSTMAALR